MQETLAHDWRKRMAARSSVCAMLLAVPVTVAALIGFSAGPGGLPFGISSLTSGPSPEPAAFGSPSAAAQNLSSPVAGAPAAAGAPAPTHFSDGDSPFAPPAGIGNPDTSGPATGGGDGNQPGDGGGTQTGVSGPDAGVRQPPAPPAADDPGPGPTIGIPSADPTSLLNQASGGVQQALDALLGQGAR